jgi:uncharacterized membrane protein YphA (DoxX/SURF4 family)
MRLVRFIARAFLSSYFIAEGVRAWKNPAQSATELQECVDQVGQFADRFLPADVAAAIPRDGVDLVRLNAGAQIGAGAGFAIGLFRRPAALVLGATMMPKIMANLPRRGLPAGEAQQRKQRFATALALTGAAILAGLDTQGRPSLGWRLRHSGGFTRPQRTEGEDR